MTPANVLHVAKRGQTRPWKLQYQYQGAPKYCTAYASEDAARAAASEMLEWAKAVGRAVDVRVIHNGIEVGK